MKLSYTNIPSVFEITEVDIPSDLNLYEPNNIWDPFFSGHHPDTQELCTRHCAKSLNIELESFFNSFLSELSPLIKNAVREQYEKDLLEWWPSSFIEQFNFEAQQINIFKDSPKFNMGLHVDNGLSLGTTVINLTDSESYTEYYESNSDEVIKYRGPSAKGTGIVHINQPGLWHSGINNSINDRFILMSYFSVIEN